MLDDTTCCMAMESPQMYDLSEAVVKADFAGLNGSLNGKVNKLGSSGYGEDFGELTDLGASEVSLDLQSFVADQQFSDAIFTDIVDQRSSLLNGASAAGLNGGLRGLPPGSCSSLAYVNSYLPPQVPCSQRPGPPAALSLKKEPDSTVYSACRPSIPGAGFQTSGSIYSPPYINQSSTLPLAGQRVSLNSQNAGGRPKQSSGGKRQDRNTDEYRRRRERNNVAVRKSREKAKVRTMETEERVKYLSRENEGHQKRIEMLSKELNVLKNLFANVGVLPDQLQREINKQLGDGYATGRGPPSGAL